MRFGDLLDLLDRLGSIRDDEVMVLTEDADGGLARPVAGAVQHSDGIVVLLLAPLPFKDRPGVADAGDTTSDQTPEV